MTTHSDVKVIHRVAQNQLPSVTVDTLIFTVRSEATANYRKLPAKKLNILLIKRADPPFQNCWALPGGCVKLTESLDDAAKRELLEETGVNNVYLEQLYTWGTVNRDPRTRMISTSYMALIDSTKQTLSAGNNATQAQWFSVEIKVIKEGKTPTSTGHIIERSIDLLCYNAEMTTKASLLVVKTRIGSQSSETIQILTSDNLAFDHARIIFYGLERLRNKIKYTDIAFQLMPEQFTLTELQQVYEVILGKELIDANFRRKIVPMVSPTNDRKAAAGHRPSRLYRFNPLWAEM